MPDALSRVFKDNLFETSKSSDRDWEKIADRAGEALYEEIGGMFKHPEVALCAIVHCMAELVMCSDRAKRSHLLILLKDAVQDRVSAFEMEDAEEEVEPGEDAEDGPEEEAEETDPMAEVDYEGPEEEDGEEEPEGEEEDHYGYTPTKAETDIRPVPPQDTNGLSGNDNPAKSAGFQPGKRRPEGKT